MTTTRHITVTVLALAMLMATSLVAEQLDLSSPAIIEMLEGEARVTGSDATGLRTHFPASERWSGLTFPAKMWACGSDWSTYTHLAVELTLTEGSDQKMNARIASRTGATRGMVQLKPGIRLAFAFPLNKTVGGEVYGMQAQPTILDLPQETIEMSPTMYQQDTDIATVEYARFSFTKPEQPAQITFHSVRLVSIDRSPRPLVDRFGQRIGGEWPGKVHSETELRQFREREELDLRRNPKIPTHGTYGGWKDGPRLESNGRFSVRKHRGKWWFVDPEGLLFLSTGLDSLREQDTTITHGREEYFQWLPKNDDPASKYRKSHRGGAFDFHRLNRERRYGQAGSDVFADTATRRSLSWGFTTIGDWYSTRRNRRRPGYCWTNMISGSRTPTTA